MKGFNEINEIEYGDYHDVKFDPECTREPTYAELYTYDREIYFEDSKEPEFQGLLLLVVGKILKDNPKWLSLVELRYKVEWTLEMMALYKTMVE